MEEEIVETPSSLCRICFDVGNYKLNSHQIIIDEERVDIRDIFNEFSLLEINYSDHIPSMLCSSCLRQLGECFIFLRKIKKADEQIKELFGNTITAEEDSSIVKNSVEYNSDYEYVVIDDMKYEDNQVINDEELIQPKLEQSEIPEEYEENAIESEQIYHQQKPTNNRKRPVFMLTNNVSNILTKAHQISHENIEEDDEDETYETVIEEPVSKKSKHEGKTFVVTKFVFVEPTTTPNFLTAETNCDDVGEQNPTTHQIRMLDIAAVEVDSPEDISFNLDDDSNIENPNIVYMCKYCPKAYSTSLHLIMHARKSHVCQFCMQGFNKVDDLHRHTKTHTHFKCYICNKDFSNNSNLRHHLKKSHELELPAHMSILEVKKKTVFT